MKGLQDTPSPTLAAARASSASSQHHRGPNPSLALAVLVAGVSSPTGQSVARSLAADGGFRVTGLCTAEMGSQLSDHSGALAGRISFVDSSERVTVDAVDALVIATDAPPPAESVEALLQCCSRQGVPHVVLLSRLGASRSRLRLGGWRAAEQAALALADEIDLTILRCGPLLGGQYQSQSPDRDSWVGRDEAELTDNFFTAASIHAGDLMSGAQAGYGTSRRVAAGAVGAALRRGPPQRDASFAVVGHASSEERPPTTTAAAWDTLFEQAAEEAGVRPRVLPAEPTTARQVSVDMSDARLAELISAERSVSAVQGASLALSGPYWGTLFLVAIYLVDGLTRPSRGWCTDNPGPNAMRMLLPDLATSCAERFPEMMHMQELREALYF